MPVTVNINGLSLVHRSSGGVSSATIPDVCLTPSPGGPIPLPYPNVALSLDVSGGTTSVTADGGNMCAINGSEFSRSTGDEPGTAGGVLSGTFIKEASWLTFSLDVTLEGQGACRLSDKMFHNHFNTVNAAGVVQEAIADPILRQLCKILCECIKEGKASKNAKWTSMFKERLAKNPRLVAAMEKAGWKVEQKLAVTVAEGTAEALGRKAVAQVAERAVVAEAEEVTVKTLGKQVAKKAGAKLGGGLVSGPLVEIVEPIMLAWTIYDVVTIIPDLVKLIGRKPATIADLKFPGDSYRNGAEELYAKAAGGKPPITLDAASCKC
jgi:hypothetical protein